MYDINVRVSTITRSRKSKTSRKSATLIEKEFFEYNKNKSARDCLAYVRDT